MENVSNEQLKKVISDFEKIGIEKAFQQGFSLDYLYMAKELLATRQTIERFEDAWLMDETIQADGSMRPSLSKTIARYEQIIADKDKVIERLVADGERIAAVLREEWNEADRVLRDHEDLMKEIGG